MRVHEIACKASVWLVLRTVQRVPSHSSARLPELSTVPTAMQRAGPVQEIDASPLMPKVSATGLTVFSKRQLAPSHSSASGTLPVLVTPAPSTEPTAMQADVLVHHTPPRLVNPSFTVVSSRQLVPFHSCASVVSAATLPAWPTAMHRLMLAHDTDVRPPFQSAVPRIVHLWPFQLSASGRTTWPPVKDSPTATQRPALAHETPAKLLETAPAGSGVLSRRHRVPFQTSATVPPAVNLDPQKPTATQRDAARHDTPVSVIAWPGFGAGFSVRHLVPFHASAA